MDLLPAGLCSVEPLWAPLCLAVPEAHTLAARRRSVIFALAGEPLILAPVSPLHREFVGRALSQIGPQQLERTRSRPTAGCFSTGCWYYH